MDERDFDLNMNASSEDEGFYASNGRAPSSSQHGSIGKTSRRTTSNNNNNHNNNNNSNNPQRNKYLKRGYMQRQRNWITGWVTYYFVLTERSLHYFTTNVKGQDSGLPPDSRDGLFLGDRKGTIDLLDIVLELPETDPNRIELVTLKSGKVRVFRCSDANEANQWAASIVATQIELCHHTKQRVPQLSEQPSPIYARIMSNIKHAHSNNRPAQHNNRQTLKHNNNTNKNSAGHSSRNASFAASPASSRPGSAGGLHNRRTNSAQKDSTQFSKYRQNNFIPSPATLNNHNHSQKDSKHRDRRTGSASSSALNYSSSSAARPSPRKLDFPPISPESSKDEIAEEPEAMIGYVQHNSNQKQVSLRIGVPFHVHNLREGEEVVVSVAPNMSPIRVPYATLDVRGEGSHTYLSTRVESPRNGKADQQQQKGALRVSMRWRRLPSSSSSSAGYMRRGAPRAAQTRNGRPGKESPNIKAIPNKPRRAWSCGYLFDFVVPVLALLCCVWMILVDIFQAYPCTRESMLALRFVNFAVSVPAHFMLPALKSLGLEHAQALTVVMFTVFGGLCAARLLFASVWGSPNATPRTGVLPRGNDFRLTITRIEKTSMDLLSSYLSKAAFNVDELHEFPCGHWTQSDITGIKVRGPNYNRVTNRVKIPATKHLFTLLHFQISETPVKLSHIARAPDAFLVRRRKLQRAILKHKLKTRPELEKSMHNAEKRADLMTESFPLMFIINFQIPGYSTVCYLEMNKEELHRVKRFNRHRTPSGGRARGGARRPPPYDSEDNSLQCISENEEDDALSLLSRQNSRGLDDRLLFERKHTGNSNRDDEEEEEEEEDGFDVLLQRFLSSSDKMRNARFKLIPRVVEGNYLVKKVVGTTPAIVGTKLYQRCYREEDPYLNYIEVDIDVTSSLVGARILKLCKGYSSNLVIDLMFLIEAQEHDELPERLIGGVRIIKADLSKCDSFPESTVKACQDVKNG